MLKKETSKDPIVAAANVYKVLNENDRVRVLEVVFKPGDVAKMHHHPEHVVYVLKGGRVKITSAGKTNEMEMKTGSVVFLPAQDHEALNIGNSTVELIVVELKK